MAQRVLAAVDDMFFASKIKATAEHLGIDIRSSEARKRPSNPRAADPIARHADLHSERCDPFALAE